MSGQNLRTARLNICRGNAAEPLRYQRFNYDFEEGQSVLDALRWIRAHDDASLAVRFACINANACKECLMRIDGRNAYACTTRLIAGEMTLEPLANKRLIRDLVCDTVPPGEHWSPTGEDDDD
jgi:succinate dehydrogenase/fumarate reductase-like Fe-S protein